jgi:hypothetical protein
MPLNIGCLCIELLVGRGSAGAGGLIALAVRSDHPGWRRLGKP